MNHREGERSTTDVPVIVYSPICGPIQARLCNVSMSGAGIEYPECFDIKLMEMVELLISPPRSGAIEPLRIDGFVVRRHSGWLGVMFMRDEPLLPRSLRDAASGSKGQDSRTVRPPVLSGRLFSDS